MNSGRLESDPRALHRIEINRLFKELITELRAPIHHALAPINPGTFWLESTIETWQRKLADLPEEDREHILHKLGRAMGVE